MNKTIPILLILMSFSIKAETFGNWSYSIPADSPFLLNPIDNGLYLQFKGEVQFGAKIAVRLDTDGKPYDVIAILNKEDVARFPLRELGGIQKPEFIQLLGSEEFLESVDMGKLEGFGSSSSTLVIGNAVVALNGLQSGADCGVANFFVFKNTIKEFRYSENTEVYHEASC